MPKFRAFICVLSIFSGMFFAGISKAAEQGYVLTTGIWQNKIIPVCWINPSTNTAIEQQWVQRAVDRTWTRNSQVSFVGWGQCPAANNRTTLRIQIADVHPNVKDLGSRLVNHATGMQLNFTFGAWSPSCANSGATFRRQCIESIAVHEFGHVLSFAHEQNRPDTPTATCTDAPQGSNGNVTVGSWDLNSVMNYCNPLYNGAGSLSPIDIQTVQQYYGAPLKDSNLTFDAQFYLSIYPDLSAAFGKNYDQARNHWLNHGIKEGRRASKSFDVQFYLNTYPDLRSAFGSNYRAAIDHWITFGINEGRQGSNEVHSAYYLNRYFDLKAAFGNNYRQALNHFDAFGLREGRQASSKFSVTNYLNRYVDLRNAFDYTSSFTTLAYDTTLGFTHWVRYGKNEGRVGN
jgi:hypothetical protein